MWYLTVFSAADTLLSLPKTCLKPGSHRLTRASEMCPSTTSRDGFALETLDWSKTNILIIVLTYSNQILWRMHFVHLEVVCVFGVSFRFLVAGACNKLLFDFTLLHIFQSWFWCINLRKINSTWRFFVLKHYKSPLSSFKRTFLRRHEQDEALKCKYIKAE